MSKTYRIKPLVWCSRTEGWAIATPAPGVEYHRITTPSRSAWICGHEGGVCGSWEEAECAAEQHWHARVVSALQGMIIASALEEVGDE